jgi:two-component system, OmpR family, phosphate regulon sensor histidine kinase PhoR
VLLQVADTGVGIPSEELPRLFSRLYRAENPAIQGVGDPGIGLSIVKSLVEALGGRIWVDSAPGKGSTFSVLLPILHSSSSGDRGQPA